MRKSFNLIWMVFGFLLLIVGCNEDKKSTAFDPNQPVKFTEFMPDSGGIRTKFIVKGSNFGEDKSQVKVYFKDEVGNEREALVLGVKPDVIYAQGPKQAGGESHVRVEIAGKEAELSNAEKTFKQALQANRDSYVSMLELAEIFYLRQQFAQANEMYGNYARVVGDNNQDARGLWVGIRVARANGDNMSKQVLVNQLRALFPNSQEYQRYLQLQYSTEAVWK